MKRRYLSPIPQRHSKCTSSNLFQRSKHPLQEEKSQDDSKLKKFLILENESDEFSLSSDDSDSKSEGDSGIWSTIEEAQIVGSDEARDSDTEEWEPPETMRLADSVYEREIPVHLRANRKDDLELDCPGLTSTQIEECHHPRKSNVEVKRCDFGDLSPILEHKSSRRPRAGAETFQIENISPIGVSKFGRKFRTSSKIEKSLKHKDVFDVSKILPSKVSSKGGSKFGSKFLTSTQIEYPLKHKDIFNVSKILPSKVSSKERRKKYSHTVGSETYNCHNISQSESTNHKRINLTSNAGHSKVSSKDSPEDSESDSQTLISNQFENTDDFFNPVPLHYSSDENNVTENVDTEDLFHPVPLHYSSDENNVTENVVEINPEELGEIPGVFTANTEEPECISVSKETFVCSEKWERNQAVVQSSSKGGQQNSEESLQLNSNDHDTSLSSTKSKKKSSRENLFKKYEEILKNIPICPLAITKTPFQELKIQHEKKRRENVRRRQQNTEETHQLISLQNESEVRVKAVQKRRKK